MGPSCEEGANRVATPMKLVMTLTPGADAEVLDAQIAYHLNAGVDVVLTAAAASQDAEEALERYVRGGYVVKAPSGAGLADRQSGSTQPIG